MGKMGQKKISKFRMVKVKWTKTNVAKKIPLRLHYAVSPSGEGIL
jgi:hypothetical protein